ncbi:MAG: hypothetical protein R6V41_05220 [Desulfobacteraceae bacterium]
MPHECVTDAESTNTYVLNFNSSAAENCGAIFPEPVKPSFVYADRINIDVPVNLLFLETVNPVESIDRLISVDLRIQNILDEYLAQTRKYERLLNDLRIPYLEIGKAPQLKKKGAKIDPESVASRRKDLKKALINTVQYSGPGQLDSGKQHNDYIVALHKIKEQREKKTPDDTPGIKPDSGLESLSRPVSNPGDNTGYHNGQLPWFFSFVLSVFKYGISHKTEIVFWSVFSCFMIFFAIAVKVKQ